MNVPPRFASVVAILLHAAPASGQNYYDLAFNNPVQQVNEFHSQVGDYYTGTTFDFLNVAPGSGQQVDARLTVTDVTSPRYGYRGAVPDYSGTPGIPGGDIGLLYDYEGGVGPSGNYGPGSVTYHLEFFRSGSNFTDPFAIPDFRIMVYEVDGEPTQDEAVVVFPDNGLVSYQLPASAQVSVADHGDGYFLFEAPGVNYPFKDPRASFLLRYQNTSSITLQVVANTYNNTEPNNGVFIAIDGDLGTINPGMLAPPVYVVPEPSAAALLLLAAGGSLFRRRRH